MRYFSRLSKTTGQLKTWAADPGPALDFEADRLKTYEVIVTATDGDHILDLTASTLVVITVLDVDEAPTFRFTGNEDGTTTNPIMRSIVEGTDVPPVGLPVVAPDPDGTSVTYMVTTDDER